MPVLISDAGRKYIYGLTLAYETDQSGNFQAAYQNDGLGSERALTDISGNIIQSYQYEEFGAATMSLGTSQQPFGYAGEEQDKEPQLEYLRARIYDPRFGRFLQRDPVRKSGPAILGWNQYTYVYDNPTNLKDPLGLDVQCQGAVGGTYIGGGRIGGVAFQNCSGDVLTQTIWVDLWSCSRVVGGNCEGSRPVERLGRCDTLGPGELVCPVQAPSPLVGLISGRVQSGLYMLTASHKWVDFTSVESVLRLGAYDTSTSYAIYVPVNDEEPTGPYGPFMAAKSQVLRF
jgi:RHS repeat-associated protein